MKHGKKVLMAALFLAGALACKKKDSQKSQESTQDSPLPTIAASPVTLVSDTAALAGGTVTAGSNGELTAIGVFYDTLPQPTQNKIALKSLAQGSFAIKLPGLKNGYKYYVRTYASNSLGTSYGTEQEFTTPAAWSKVDSSALDVYRVNALVAVGNSIYAGTGRGVYYSADEGGSWTSIGLTHDTITALAAREGVLFVGGYNYIHCSTDNGASWKAVHNKFPVTLYSLGDLILNDNELLACTFQGVYATADNGASWTAELSGLPPARYYSHFTKNSGGIYVSSSNLSGLDADVYMNPAGETGWRQAGPSGQLQNCNINGIGACGSNLFISTTDFATPRVSANNGLSWSQSSQLPGNTTLFNTNGATVLCTTSTGRYLISNDEGTSWMPLSTRGIAGNLPTAILLTEHYIYAATWDKGLYRRPRFN